MIRMQFRVGLSNFWMAPPCHMLPHRCSPCYYAAPWCIMGAPPHWCTGIPMKCMVLGSTQTCPTGCHTPPDNLGSSSSREPWRGWHSDQKPVGHKLTPQGPDVASWPPIRQPWVRPYKYCVSGSISERFWKTCWLRQNTPIEH